LLQSSSKGTIAKVWSELHKPKYSHPSAPPFQRVLQGYIAAGQYDDILKTIRWGTDYLIKCVGDGDDIVVQVNNGAADHAVWGRPEDVKLPVPVYSVTPSAPGSDCVGAMAAALASASEVFAKVDPEYSEKLLEAAIKAYK
jgi:hypothetical protein